MTIDHSKLSAYLDGELQPAEMSEIEAALQNDEDLQAEFELLLLGDEIATQDLTSALEQPVPLSLVAAINNAPDASPANSPQKPFRMGLVAAALVCVAFVGLAGGYYAGSSRGPIQTASAPKWVSDIADYHRVYAQQGRHLVEVRADEKDHIETWLTKVVGADVRVPDLSDHGLTFQGGRLLVAAGKPVAQLMYTDDADRVVALCLIRTDTPAPDFKQRSIDEFEMVTWGGATRNFIIIGDVDRSDLGAIAESAAQRV